MSVSVLCFHKNLEVLVGLEASLIQASLHF